MQTPTSTRLGAPTSRNAVELHHSPAWPGWQPHCLLSTLAEANPKGTSLSRDALIVVALVLTLGACNGHQSSPVRPTPITVLAPTPAPVSVEFAGRTRGPDTASTFFHYARSLLLNRLSSRDVTVDAVGVDSFDLDFYRFIVRGGVGDADHTSTAPPLDPDADDLPQDGRRGWRRPWT